jgi:hypothetical protein
MSVRVPNSLRRAPQLPSRASYTYTPAGITVFHLDLSDAAQMRRWGVGDPRDEKE